MIRIRTRAITVLAGLMLGTSAALTAQLPEAERKATSSQPAFAQDSVIAAVEESLRAMEARDVAASRRVLLPEGVGYATRATPEGLRIGRETHEEFHDRLAGLKDVWVERIWDPTVLVHGNIATLWAPYDFHINGEFSHCGIDAVTLVRTADGWQIVTWVWTVEPVGCEPSPLGPLTPAG